MKGKGATSNNSGVKGKGRGKAKGGKGKGKAVGKGRGKLAGKARGKGKAPTRRRKMRPPKGNWLGRITWWEEHMEKMKRQGEVSDQWRETLWLRIDVVEREEELNDDEDDDDAKLRVLRVFPPHLIVRRPWDSARGYGWRIFNSHVVMESD